MKTVKGDCASRRLDTVLLMALMAAHLSLETEREVEESCAKTREIPRQNDVGENVRTPPSFSRD